MQRWSSKSFFSPQLCWPLILSLAAMLAGCAAPQPLGEETPRLPVEDGTWTGYGWFDAKKIWQLTCPGGKIPIMFSVSEGTATSLLPESSAGYFRTRLGSNGSIRFSYKGKGESLGVRSVPVKFTGRLSGSKGGGDISFSDCQGHWEASRSRAEGESPRKAAEQGDADAQVKLGNMYREGKGVAKDDAEAAKWYRKAAEQGDDTAQNNLGWMYRKGYGVEQDYKEAVSWYRKAAEQGYARAQNSLGWMYQKGYGVNRDYSEALKWYFKAAEQGNVRAQNNLGWMYREGWGVAQDDAEAVAWYRKSANQGHARAQNNLGEMYLEARGVPQDDVQAYMWFELAASQGHREALQHRERVAERMTPEQVAEAKGLAERLRQAKKEALREANVGAKRPLPLKFPKEQFAIDQLPADWEATPPIKYVLASWKNPRTEGSISLGADPAPTLRKLSWSGWSQTFRIGGKQVWSKVCTRSSVTPVEGFEESSPRNGFRRTIIDSECQLSGERNLSRRSVLYVRKGDHYLYWISLGSPIATYDANNKVFEAMVDSFRMLEDD